MKKNVVCSGIVGCLVLFFLLAGAGPVFAGGVSLQEQQDVAELKALVQQLLKQNQALSKRVSELEKRPAVSEEKNARVAGEKAAEEGAKKPMFSFEGALRAGFTADSNEEGSDFGMAAVELLLSAQVNKWVSGQAVFLYENPPFADDSNVFIEDAFIKLGNLETFPFYAQAGVFFVPYGALLTHFPDDPLVDVPVSLSFGEMEEHAFLVGFEKGGFAASAYCFNGDVEDDDGDDHVEDFGFDVNYTFSDEGRGFDFMVGGSYVSNVADTDGLSDIFGDEIKDKEGGIALYSEITFGRFFILGEYMTALDEIESRDGSVQGEPSVWNVEAGFNYDGFIRPFELVFKYAGSDDDAERLGFFEDRYGLALNIDLFENTGIGMGYFHDEYDPKYTGDNNRDVFFSQVEFSF